MASLIDAAGRPLKGLAKDAPPKPAAPGAAPSANVPSANVKDSTLATFAADVLDASMEVPVIVDFWAPWCGPCKTLGPHLERAVEQAKGAVRLVKVNIDENPEIAQQLRIQSIPTVYAFKNGAPVDGFMGALPESQIKAFVQGLIGPDAGADAAKAEEEALALAATALEQGDFSTAAQIYGHILQEDPGNPKAVAGLARCYLKSGDLERAKNTLGLVRPDAKADESIRAVEAELSLKERAASAGDLDPLRAKLAADPADMQTRFDLATALEAKGEREAAIEELLEIVRRNRKWNEDAARKQLVILFDAGGLGNFMFKRIGAGVTPRQLWMYYGLFWLANFALEMPGLNLGIYQYYGDQPFKLFGFPLWMAMTNAVMPLLGGALLNLFKDVLTGPRVLLAIPMMPMVTGMPQIAIGWPTWLALNSGGGPVVTHAAALISLGLSLTAVYLIGSRVCVAAGAAANEPDFTRVVTRPGNN